MATQPQTSLTYEDLQAFPDDNLRRELIDGELIVTPAPGTRHQQVVLRLAARLLDYAEQRGGNAFDAPTDVYLTDDTVVEPDVLFVRPEHSKQVTSKYVEGSPDVVIEVSSPSTRPLEVGRKRAVYERFGVPEYWYVDLDADRVEIYRLEGNSYPRPQRSCCTATPLGRPSFPGFGSTLITCSAQPPGREASYPSSAPLLPPRQGDRKTCAVRARTLSRTADRSTDTAIPRSSSEA